MLKLQVNGVVYEVQDTYGNVIVGYKVIRYLMPMYVQHITEHHKVTRGCDT